MASLRAMHAGLRDDGHLVRMAPGTAPGVDLAGLDLHSIRDSALGAHLDLTDGEVARAEAAIREILRHQYTAPGRPWDGTFKVTAEQADPPGDEAVEWFHYDPNWRQFIGCFLAQTLEDHGHLLPADLRDAMLAAVVAAVEGEPAGRIPRWYTNPNLMAAWLAAWAGRRVNRPELIGQGTERAAEAMQRLATYGDVDEYNSPTYDGVDLYAAALWVAFPPTDDFAAWGETMIRTIGARLGTLYHPGLGAVAGPHIRAYGLGLDRYVSIVGLWLALAGEPVGRVLPAVLDEDTVHVHDLYFVPVLASLADHVLPSLTVATTFPRRHEQRFRHTTAVSQLFDTHVLGAETGREVRFSRDQYVGCTAHVAGADGRTDWVGAQLGPTTARLDGTIVDDVTVVVVAAGRGAGGCDLALLWSGRPELVDRRARLGALTATFDEGPSTVEVEEAPDGVRTSLTFEADEVIVRIAVDR